MKPATLERGAQVIYVPVHAGRNTAHPDAEQGFVTSVCVDLGVAYCRYWSKARPGELRTKANSEATPLDQLVMVDTRPPAVVAAALAAIDAEPDMVTHET